MHSSQSNLMTWKDKIEQLAALLEKIPHPQIFEVDKGVYQPYFVLELRTANWEIIPLAEYTRMDGIPGKEIRLTYQLIETQKVNITQDELNLLTYLLSFNTYDTRRLFTYGQPVGFLLDWLRGSFLRMRMNGKQERISIDFSEDTGTISLGIFKESEEYHLQPIIVFPDHTVFLDGPIEVLTSNPIYVFNKNVLYRVDSRMPAFFWINFFRLQQMIRIPEVEIKDFIASFVSKILPALDWKSLEEHLKVYDLPLTKTKIQVSERAGQFSIEVKFVYKNVEFSSHPTSQKSLASQGKYLFIVKRDTIQESDIRKQLHECGLLYIQHRWQVDPQIPVLDWLRLHLPQIARPSIEISGEDNLKRFRLKRGSTRLTTKVSSAGEWFDFQFQLMIGDEKLDIPNLKEMIKNYKNYLRLADGTHIHVGEDLTRRLDQFLHLLNQSAASGHEKFLAGSFPLIEELLKLSDEVETDDHFVSWQTKYRNFQKIQSVLISNHFQGKLRDYQKTGLDWLAFLNKFGFGGILADDMGLGKTIQVIALLLHLKHENRLKKPSLIVVPLTVLFNWESEFKRFAPKLRIMAYEGQRSDREALAQKFESFDVILLSYGILLQDQSVLQKMIWEYAILDESQKIKNPQTKTYQAVETLKASNRLCLTGTPVENSVIDLWSQFNFLNPGMLGSVKQFESRFGGDGVDGSPQIEVLRRLIHPFVLRRRKEEVLEELPDRTDIIQYIEMTENQHLIYNKWLEHYRIKIFQEVDTHGLPKARLKILEALTYLRQLACHPGILDPEIDLMDSGKVQLLEEMLEEILVEGHKVLIFSQFVRFLALVKKILDQKKWKYEYLDGSTRNRERVIRSFQEKSEVRIFLISLKAGGLGLNLTAADYVIHLDPWWNPAVEQQATDRAHRIGQMNRVFVYKYIVKNSVEEKILLLQEKKKQISDHLIVSEKGLIKQLNMDDIRQIFNTAN